MKHRSPRLEEAVMSLRTTQTTVHRCVIVLVVGFALAGCVTPDRAAPHSGADGVLCGASKSEAVYLEVRYEADGMPSVEPAVCEIDRGTRVTWRGPVDTPVGFTIRFKADSPVKGEPRGTFSSDRGADRYRVQRTLDGPAGRYDYAVIANGRELDPAIIIR
jgi:hypothetical protein